MNKNPLFKLAAASLIAIVVLWVIQVVITGTGYGYGMNFRGNLAGHDFGGGIYMGNSFFNGGTITYLLLILIKVLFVLFVLGLIAGLVVWIKNNIFTVEEREAIRNTFTFKPTKKEVCSECGKELSSTWKVCPYCSKEKESAANV